jgi:hypothetical protein
MRTSLPPDWAEAFEYLRSTGLADVKVDGPPWKASFMYLPGRWREKSFYAEDECDWTGEGIDVTTGGVYVSDGEFAVLSWELDERVGLCGSVTVYADADSFYAELDRGETEEPEEDEPPDR